MVITAIGPAVFFIFGTQRSFIVCSALSFSFLLLDTFDPELGQNRRHPSGMGYPTDPFVEECGDPSIPIPILPSPSSPLRTVCYSARRAFIKERIGTDPSAVFGSKEIVCGWEQVNT